MGGFVSVGQELEMAFLLDWEPVEVFQILVSLGQVEDQCGGCILDHLESLDEFGGGACIECVAIVQSACDEGMCYCLPGADGEPHEKLAEHAKRVEAD